MKLIENIIINKNPMTSALEVRSFTVIGDPGAIFSLTTTNKAGRYYNFSEKRDRNGDLETALAFGTVPIRLSPKVIGNDGTYTGVIQFPAITSDDEYRVTLYAESTRDTELSSSLSNNSVYILPKIYKYKDTTVTFSLSSAGSSGSYNTLPSNVTFTGISTSAIGVKTSPQTSSISWPVSLSSSQFVIAKQPTDSDFQFTTTKLTKTDNTGITIELQDITGLSTRMDVTGTGIAANNVVKSITKGFIDTNNSSELGDIYVVPVAVKTDDEGNDILGDDTGGTIAISNSSNWGAGVTLTFTGKGSKDSDEFNNTIFEVSNFLLTIDPVTTTTDAAMASNSVTVPLTSTDGIKAVDTVLMTGIGVTGTPHVDSVSSGASVNVSVTQIAGSIENGQTLTFTGSSRSATITADVKVLQYGDDDITLTLALDNILTVA
jgi:hypothetical protein|tara:strand:+ start:2507 stop:3805 length:1299 start_codon:yes stop_codon:yes gene_type:complete